jgi:signal transduction histidine kinase
VKVHLGADAVLTVTDEGRGMAPDEIKRIGAFRQSELGKEQEIQGMGLGLALVGKLAAKCGAQLTMGHSEKGGLAVEIAFLRRQPDALS